MMHHLGAPGPLAGRRAAVPTRRAAASFAAVSSPPSLLLRPSSASRRAPQRPVLPIARAAPDADKDADATTDQRASNGLGNLFLKEGAGEDLDSRIASGEFTDSGSTKEQLTRPLRKALAQDPLGIGESNGTSTRPR
jgi:hypothetical protein